MSQHTALLREGLAAASAAAEVGARPALRAAVTMLEAAADLTAMLADIGTDPAEYVVPPALQACIKEALAAAARIRADMIPPR